MDTGLFSNTWWTWTWNTYSMSILGVPLLIGFLLKLAALFNPRIPSNAIIDLLKEYWPSASPKQDAIDKRQDTVDRMQTVVDQKQVVIDKDQKAADKVVEEIEAPKIVGPFK